MENFQLYRTNLLLGGQMKWDIIVSESNDNLSVSDFHLTPISNNVSYVDRFDEKLLNNTHQDNVKAYYKKNKGVFYEEGLDSMFEHNYPVIVQPDESIKCYSDTYDMGCKRAIRYARYNKQFEYFCPLWIEQLNNKLIFSISVYDDANNYIATKKLELNKSSENPSTYHDKFSKYFYDYIEYTGINTGDDNLINISFNKSNAIISGLDASTGMIETLDINSLTTNFISRERPVMEIDNMIMQSFVGKVILAKQLFNFNICFNLNDIISWQIAKILVGEKFKITIEVSIDDVILDKRDFYTNYEYIEKCTNLSADQLGMNVFDYLADNKALELINKNKYCQKICHWSLADNNDYIFNIYNGFSGVHIDNNKYKINDHNYLNFPNLVAKEVTDSNFADFWLNVIDIKYFYDFNKYVSSNTKIEEYGKRIESNVFINNVKFKAFPKINCKEAYVLGLNFVSENSNEMMSNYKNRLTGLNWKEIIQDDNTKTYNCVLYKDNYIIFISDDRNAFAYSNLVNTKFGDSSVYDNQNQYDLVKPSIDFINNYSLGKINPSIVQLNNSLSYYNSIGPTKNHKEIEYFKADNVYNYVIRYDGKLKPTFVENGNYIYYKDYISINDIKNTVYSNYSKYGFEPLYPSINYCAIKNNLCTYNELPNFAEGVKINPEPEYSWFNTNTYFWMDDTIKFGDIQLNSVDSESINERITDLIKEHYAITDDEIAKYIINKYNCVTKLTGFESDTYIYNITLTLK